MRANFWHWIVAVSSMANLAVAEPALKELPMDLTAAVRQKALDKLEADLEAAKRSQSALHGRPGTVEIKSEDVSAAGGSRPASGLRPRGNIRLWTNPNIKPERVQTDIDVTEVAREEDALERELREFFQLLDSRTTEAWTDENVQALRKMHELKSPHTGVSLIAKTLRERIPGMKNADQVMYMRAVRLYLNRYQRTLELMGSATLNADTLNQALDSGRTKFQANLSAKWGEKLQKREEERVSVAMNFGTHAYVALMRNQLWVLKNGSNVRFPEFTANVAADIASIYDSTVPQPLASKASAVVAPVEAHVR